MRQRDPLPSEHVRRFIAFHNEALQVFDDMWKDMAKAGRDSKHLRRLLDLRDRFYDSPKYTLEVTPRCEFVAVSDDDTGIPCMRAR